MGICSYKNISKSVSDIAIKRYKGTSGAFIEELVALAFFDNDVSNDIKHRMVMVLQRSRSEHPQKGIAMDQVPVIPTDFLQHHRTAFNIYN